MPLEALVNDLELRAAQRSDSTEYCGRWTFETGFPFSTGLKGFQPPVPPLAAVARPRLITKLDDAARSTLCVLSAPPGYGKTTLLSQWAASRAHAGVRLRWISLTGTRNRGPRFVADLEAPLGCSSSTPGTVRRGRAPERPTSVRRVSDVLDDLGAIPPTTVVIDNFH